MIKYNIPNDHGAMSSQVIDHPCTVTAYLLRKRSWKLLKSQTFRNVIDALQEELMNFKLPEPSNGAYDQPEVFVVFFVELTFEGGNDSTIHEEVRVYSTVDGEKEEKDA